MDRYCVRASWSHDGATVSRSEQRPAHFGDVPGIVAEYLGADASHIEVIRIPRKGGPDVDSPVR